MVSEAYERNFRGMASAIDNANKSTAQTKGALADLMRQHADLVMRVAALEAELQRRQGGRA